MTSDDEPTSSDGRVSRDLDMTAEEIAVFKQRLADAAKHDERQRRMLRIANLIVLVSAVVSAAFFLVASFSTGGQIRRLNDEKKTLEVARALLSSETKELEKKADDLRQQVQQLARERDALRLWSDKFYGQIELAAESNDGNASEILRTTPPPPTAAPDAMVEARSLWREGQLAAESGDSDRAEARYLQAIQVNPEYARALNSMGLLRHRQGRNTEALSYYRNAAKADPNYAPALGNLASLLLQTDNVPEAILWCSRALALEEPPKVIFEVQGHLGTLGIGCTERDAAERFFREGENAYAAGKRDAGLRLIKQGCDLGEQLACRFLKKRCDEGVRDACVE